MFEMYKEQFWNCVQDLIKYKPTIFELHILEGESIEIILENEKELQDLLQTFSSDDRFQIPAEIKAFWQQLSQLKLIWYAGKDYYEVYEPNLNYATVSGRINILPLDNIFLSPINNENPNFNFFTTYHPFDQVSVSSYVTMKFDPQTHQPTLYYFDKPHPPYKLSLDFTQYVLLLLETRGLEGWQAYFIDDQHYHMPAEQDMIFKQKLQFLFPDVNVDKYQVNNS